MSTMFYYTRNTWWTLTFMGSKLLTYHQRIHLLNLRVIIKSWLHLLLFMQMLGTLLFHVKFNAKRKLRATHMKLKNIRSVAMDIKLFVNMMINIQKESKYAGEKMLLSSFIETILKEKKRFAKFVKNKQSIIMSEEDNILHKKTNFLPHVLEGNYRQKR